MKNKCFPHLLGIGLLIAAAILAAYGQTTGPRSSLAVYVPFDFVVGDKTLLSGRYELTPTSDRVLRVQSADGMNSAFVQTRAVSGRKPDSFEHVVFNCYGDRCFLSQVWAAEHDLGRELKKCSLEERLAEKPTGHDVAVLTVKPKS